MLPNIYLNCEANCCEISLLSFVMPVFTLIIFSIWVVITRPISAATAMSPSPLYNIWPRAMMMMRYLKFLNHKYFRAQHILGNKTNPKVSLQINGTFDKRLLTGRQLAFCQWHCPPRITLSLSTFSILPIRAFEPNHEMTSLAARQAGAASRLASLSSSQH